MAHTNKPEIPDIGIYENNLPESKKLKDALRDKNSKTQTYADVYDIPVEQKKTKVDPQNDAPIDNVYEIPVEQAQTKADPPEEGLIDDFYEIPAGETQKKPETETEASVDDNLYEPVIVKKQDEELYTKLIHNDSIETQIDKAHQSEKKIDKSNIYVNWGFHEDSKTREEEVEKGNDVNEDEIVEEKNEPEKVPIDESGVKSYAAKFPRIASLLQKLKASDANQDEIVEAEENRSDNKQDNQLQIEETGDKSYASKFPRIASFLKEPDKVAKTADFIDKNIHKILLVLVISVTFVIILAMIITWTVK